MQASTKSSIVLLSIDDKSLTTDLDRAGYKAMGVQVRLAKNYQEANHTIQKETIDVLVINQDYKKVDAVNIVKHLKSQQDTKDLCVVVTGVQSNARKRDAVLEAGADLFVEQPIPRQHFIEKMKRLLSQATRTNDRVQVLGTAIVCYEGEAMQCTIGDVSTTGILINTGMPLDTGTKVQISLKLTDSQKPLVVDGEVVRKLETKNGSKSKKSLEEPFGLGIKFLDLNEKSRSELSHILKNQSQKKNQLSYYL